MAAGRIRDAIHGPGALGDMGLPIAVRETTIGHTAGMPEPVAILTVAVTSRALFDLEESHALYEREGVQAYSRLPAHARGRRAGAGHRLPGGAQAAGAERRRAADAPRVEVILLSRNSSDTGLRIFNSIQHYGLGIVRATFTSPANRCGPTSCRSAPSCSCRPTRNRCAARWRHGVAAATILPAVRRSNAHARPAAHRLRRRRGDLRRRERAHLARAGRGGVRPHERERAREPLSGGPFRSFLSALHQLQAGIPADGESSPIRTALVTARSAPAHERVIRTLREWGVRLDEALFLGGRAKGPFLEAFGADIFFDDSPHNIDSARLHVAAGHVPHGVANEPAR
jgi:5'-nucleotidase